MAKNKKTRVTKCRAGCIHKEVGTFDCYLKTVVIGIDNKCASRESWELIGNGTAKSEENLKTPISAIIGSSKDSQPEQESDDATAEDMLDATIGKTVENVWSNSRSVVISLSDGPHIILSADTKITGSILVK